MFYLYIVNSIKFSIFFKAMHCSSYSICAYLYSNILYWLQTVEYRIRELFLI